MSTPADAPTKRLRILTWHVHGNYLYSLTSVPHDFFVPVHADGRSGYSALGPGLPWGKNVTAIPAESISEHTFDCVIYQSRAVYEERASLLSDKQLALASIYIEHDPPFGDPTNTRHWFEDRRGVLVHVTHYNALAWDAGETVTRVIEHGVPIDPGIRYTGNLDRGICVINNIQRRGRRMGADIFDWARTRVPIDLIGMQSELVGGLGEVSNSKVAQTVANYRFFFTPIRYTSLGLALVEAMLIGVPVVGIAATELPTVIRNGENGFVHTDKQLVLDAMRALLADPAMARQWGAAGKETAMARFGMPRFIDDWNALLADVTRI